MARLIGPLSPNCTGWDDEAQKERSLRPHSKTGQRQSWKPDSLTAIHSFIRLRARPILGAGDTTVNRTVHPCLD